MATACSGSPSRLETPGGRDLPRGATCVNIARVMVKPRALLPVIVLAAPVWLMVAAFARHGLYASASLDGRTNEIVVKVVNSEAVAKPVRLAVEGAATRGDARVTTLASIDLQAENSLDQPTRVAPVESRVALGGAELHLELQPQSVTVVRLPKER